MKLVTFGRAMAPHNIGDRRLLPDALADKLDGEGVLSASEPFGPPEVAAPQQPRRPILKPARPVGPRDARVAR